MNTIMRLLLCFVLSSSSAPQDPELIQVDYRITVSDPRSETVLVEATFHNLKASTPLAMPDRAAFATFPEPSLVGEVQVLDDSATLEREGPYRWSVTPHEDVVRLSWEIVLDHRRRPQARRSRYELPYLASDHGLLSLPTLIIAPDEKMFSAARVSFDVPEHWPVFAPWVQDEDQYYLAPSYLALVSDLIAIGEWDVSSKTVEGMDLVLAFAPGQKNLKDATANVLLPILEAEIEVFERIPQPKSLFAFSSPEDRGFGGSVKANSMALFVSPELPVDFAADGIKHLIAHEFFHTWELATCSPDNDLRWFSEGFTDWYAYLIPVRLGMREAKNLADALGQKLNSWSQIMDEFPELTLADAGGPGFFEGQECYRACYDAGLVLAAWLHLRLQREEISLDDFMREFYNDPRWEDGTNPTLPDFLDLVEQSLGVEGRDLIEDAVTRPGDRNLVEIFEQVGLELEATTRPCSLDLRANFQETTIALVEPSDAAARIGLRAGDRLLEVNGATVGDEGQIRTAWQKPSNNHIHVIFDRNGTRHEIRKEIPERTNFKVLSTADWQ